VLLTVKSTEDITNNSERQTIFFVNNFIMTHIVAGKLADRTFMMADCISTEHGTRKRKFVEKLCKLESSEDTFFSMAGNVFIDNCVHTLDVWYTVNNIKKSNDFCTGEVSFNDLKNLIERSLWYVNNGDVSLGENRLFFIDKSNVVYYNLYFDDATNAIIRSDRKELNAGEYISSNFTNLDPLNHEDFSRGDLINHCKDYLVTFMGKDRINFLDRFSFVSGYMGDTCEFQRPFKAISDLIAYGSEIKYDLLDHPNFIWNLP
jgi:hypothetical protein